MKGVWYHGWYRMSADFAASMIHYLLQPRAWSWTSCFPPCKFFLFWVTVCSKYCCYYRAKSFICLLLYLWSSYSQFKITMLACDVNVRHPLFHPWLEVGLDISCFDMCSLWIHFSKSCIKNDTQNVQDMCAFIIYLHFETNHFLLPIGRRKQENTWIMYIYTLNISRIEN